MALNGYFVEKVRYSTVRPFVEKWHYSHSTNGLKVHTCFGLFRPSTFFPELVGAAIFGAPAMPSQAKSWNPKSPSKTLELRRLCCIDDTPKNTESFFISRMIRWLKYNTDVEIILSYADPYHGHEGTIYKASNFEYMGQTSTGKALLVDGKEYHTRTLSSAKPYGKKIRERYDQNDHSIELIERPAKHIYLYRIRR